MPKHIYTYQSKESTESNISNDIIKKIYDIVEQNNKLCNIIDESSLFHGKISTRYTYKKYIDTIKEKFPNLEIEYDDLFVLFADDNVRQILIDNYGGELDGILASLQVNQNDGFYKNYRNIFENNKDIETFDELNQLINVKKLGSANFKGCTNLKSITLDNIVSLGQGCFSTCSSLAIDINMPKLQTANSSWIFTSSGIISISNLGIISSIPTEMFSYCNDLTEIKNNALSGITEIGTAAFFRCKSLPSVGNLSSLITIGKQAFYECTSLTSIDLPESIQNIRSYAFYGCTSLVISDLNLPNLNTLEVNAFMSTKIKKITNLGNITTLTTSVFDDCKELNNIGENTLTNIVALQSNVFAQCSSLQGTINLPNCTSIADSCFVNCSSILNINLSNCTSAGIRTFEGCTSLTNITGIENILLNSIPYRIFFGDTNLVFPQTFITNVSSIGEQAFNGCSKLYNITLNNSNTVINNEAFYNCANLVHINNTLNITKIGANCFYGCINFEGENGVLDLSNVTGRSTLHSNGIFGRCKKIKKIIIGHIEVISSNSFTAERNTFYNCDLLHTVDIYSLDKLYLGTNPLFHSCPNIQNLIIRTSTITPIQIDTDRMTTLRNGYTNIMGDNNNAKIFVPDNLVNDYKTAEYWNSIADHIFSLNDYVPIVDE